MTERPRRKKRAAKPAGGAASKAARAPEPPASGSKLVVQFNRAEDPSAEQTAAIRNLVKQFGSSVRVSAEMPGALKLDVGSASEAAFRKAVQAEPDWDLAEEGSASMPASPLPEEDEDGHATK